MFFQVTSPYLASKLTANRFMVAGILIVSYFLRLLHTIYYQTLSRDSYTYINALENTPTASYSALHENIYPMFFFLYRLPKTIFDLDTACAGRAFNIVLGTLTVYLIMISIRYIIPNRIIWISGGLIAATSPNLIHYSSQIQRECLYLLFTAYIFLYIIKYILWKKRIDLGILCFFISCNLLTRYESVLFLPFMAFSIFLSDTQRNLLQIFLRVGICCLFIAFNVLFFLLFTTNLDFIISHIYTRILHL